MIYLPQPVPQILEWRAAAQQYLAAGMVLFPLFGKGLPRQGTSPKKLSDCITSFEAYEQHRKSGGGNEFGLACGHGLIVADLDEKPGKPRGRDSLLEITGIDPYESWTEVPYATTPSGGRHYFFSSAVPYPVRKGLLPGFDLLGLGQWAYCAPREGYKWARGGVAPDLPRAILDLVGSHSAIAPGRGSEEVEEEDVVRMHPIRALFNEHVSAEEILKRHGYRADRARGPIARYLSPISTSGSAGVSLFREPEIVYSHHGNDLITPGEGYDAFALFMQLEHGISNARLRAKGGDWNRAINLARSRLAELGIPLPELTSLEECLERFWYLAKGDRVADLQRPPSQCILRLHEFKHWLSNVRVPSGNRTVPISDLWLQDPRRRDADDTTYAPKAGRVVHDADRGLKLINEFELPTHTETDRRDKLGTFLEHLEYLVPDERDRDWFINWMAQLVQYPERRGVVPLHISTLHGTGRGWIVELIRLLLGSWNCRSTKMRDLVEAQFNDCMDNSIFCSIPEVRESTKRYAVDDQIRDALSDPYFEINKKYGPKETKRIYTSFLFASNHWDALAIGPEDRRIQVLAGPEHLMPNSYYETLYASLEDKEFIAQVWSYLKQVDLTGFDWMRSTESAARSRLIFASMTSTEHAFREFIKSPPAICATSEQVRSLVGHFRSQDEQDGETPHSSQIQKLLALHCRRLPRLKWENRAVRCWQLAELDRSLDSDAIRKELSKMEAFKHGLFDY